jgi:hypothetical protein
VKFALDPFTILFTTTLTCAVLAVAMYSMHVSLRREVAGVGHWACGLFCMVGAGGLFLSRGLLPDEAVLPAANTFLMWGIAGMDDIPRCLAAGTGCHPVVAAGGAQLSAPRYGFQLPGCSVLR